MYVTHNAKFKKRELAHEVYCKCLGPKEPTPAVLGLKKREAHTSRPASGHIAKGKASLPSDTHTNIRNQTPKVPNIMQPEPTQDPETDPETETHELLKAWRESAVEFMNMNGHLRETLATQGHQLDELRADLKAIASEFENIGTKFQGASYNR